MNTAFCTRILLFKVLSENIKCVVLSSCYSKEQAKAISKNGIYVIGMNSSVEVEAATAFSLGFYQAIGEEEDISTSFEIGLVHYFAHCSDSKKDIP